jgi:cytochrome c biogenesis protein CcmG/thiol:disulfide interchange protein DsbE
VAAVGAAVVTGLVLAGCAGGGTGGSGTSGGAATSGMMPPEARPDGTSAADAAEIARLVREANLPPCPRTSRIAPLPDGLPDLTLPCLGEGPAVTLSGLRGTPLVVNVWASWCPPCAAEMPHLLTAHKALGDRVRFLGVDLVDRRSAALAWARDFRMTFPSVEDPDGVVRAKLRLVAPPVTLFVRPDGSVAKIHYGAFANERQVRDQIAQHLGVSA